MKNELAIILVCLSALPCPSYGADFSAATITAPELAWSVVPSPREGGVTLYGVAAFSSSQTWAVGDIYSPLVPIIYRWNGAGWTSVPVGTLPNSSLRDVVAIAANDAWAVGYQEVGDDGDLTVTQHWDGLRWSRIASPNPSTENYLNGVAALATNDVWAVGHKGNSVLYGELILHWNGNAWSVSSTEQSGYRVLTDVAAVSPNDVWAIGYQFSFNHGYQGLALHWNGTGWSDVAMPVTDDGYTLLNGIAAVSASDVWAVGSSGVNPIKPLIAHWDGLTWSYLPNPALPTDYAFLKSVTALAPNDVWAAGYFTDRGVIAKDHNLVEHWDGISWTRVAVPEIRQGNNELWAIAPDQAGGLWTVGSFLTADFSRPVTSLILRGTH